MHASFPARTARWTRGGLRSIARLWVVVLCGSWLLPQTSLAGRVQHDTTRQTWTLASGPVIYRLAEKDAGLYLDYFGPASQLPPGDKVGNAPGRADFSGEVEGQSLASSSLSLISQQTRPVAPGCEQLIIVMRHKHLPLEIEARYTSWGETGVFTREFILKNLGQSALAVARAPSLSWELPGGDYTLRYLYGSWGEEHQLASEKLGPGARNFGSTRGRSSNGFAPWLSVRNEDNQVEYLAELAWSGNWDMSVMREPGTWPSKLRDQAVDVNMRVHFDFGGSLNLQPGAIFTLPKVALTASAGDLDDVTNQMHRYQRDYVFPQSTANRPPLVQFNSWYPFQGKVNIRDMLRLADVAAGIGADVFVLDAGWYNHVDWSKELGDYEPDPQAFPNGLQELSNYTREKGMKFGLWMEIENIGLESSMFQRHKDWCLAYNGAPVRQADRCQLDFAKPEVRQWATSTVDRLVSKYNLSWIKIDYNIDVGDSFDPSGKDRPGDVLYQHIAHYYAWLDDERAAYPDLIIENCSSGGLRFDTGILAHTHTNWLSDNVDPIASLGLGFGCTVQFSAEVCNHWMVGDTDRGNVDLTKPPGWWDFMFRVPMNGQFGISSRVLDWNQALKDHAAANIALYKQVRQTIAGADVYHLTAQPELHKPTGWMAIQYVSQANHSSVLTAYRLQDGPADKTLKLRGLDPSANYDVLKDGRPSSRAKGEDLMTTGLPVHLDEQWRAAIFEIKRQP
jgi:alpha-galactosidase